MFAIYDDAFARAATEGAAALRELPLDDYGLMLLDPPVPGLPRMPADKVQRAWNGASGIELLRQSVTTVRMMESAYSQIRHQGLAGRRILDIGCGWGRLTRLFLKYSDAVFAVDPWSRSIEEFKACGMTTPVALSEYVPRSYPFEAIDLAVAFSVLTHTSPKASEAILRATRTSIAEDGVFVFTIRPVEFWTFAARYKTEPDAFVAAHRTDGYAYAPHAGAAGSDDYGDASISLAWLRPMLTETGWTLAGIDRSIVDPYQVFVIATPAR